MVPFVILGCEENVRDFLNHICLRDAVDILTAEVIQVEIPSAVTFHRVQDKTRLIWEVLYHLRGT